MTAAGPDLGSAAAEWFAVDRLVPWAKNPRNNDDAVPAVAESIRRFGFSAPLVARLADCRVIAGHTRLKAAQLLGLDRVPVRFLDISETDADLLALADNRLGEIASWDDSTLLGILEGLRASEGDLAVSAVGWDAEDLDALQDSLAPRLSDRDDTLPDLDLGPAAEVFSEAGEVYALGVHRVVCGSALEAGTWEALLGLETVDMLWTDPPYGVSQSTDHLREWDGGAKRDRAAHGILNDDLSEEALGPFLRSAFRLAFDRCRKGAAWYVASPDGPLRAVFGAELLRLEIWRRSLVWVKDRFVLGRGDYHYRHEAVFYGWKPGAAHYFVEDRTQDTVIRLRSPAESEACEHCGRFDGDVEPAWIPQDSVLEVARPGRSTLHPTMKPIALIERCIRNSSRVGEIVVDPFGGSGSTLIAAAEAGRVARIIELDPRYVDAIRRRWTAWAIAKNVDPGAGALGYPSE